jgi:hypothetical protein
LGRGNPQEERRVVGIEVVGGCESESLDDDLVKQRGKEALNMCFPRE